MKIILPFAENIPWCDMYETQELIWEKIIFLTSPKRNNFTDSPDICLLIIVYFYTHTSSPIWQYKNFFNTFYRNWINIWKYFSVSWTLPQTSKEWKIKNNNIWLGWYHLFDTSHKKLFSFLPHLPVSTSAISSQYPSRPTCISWWMEKGAKRGSNTGLNCDGSI